MRIVAEILREPGCRNEFEWLKQENLAAIEKQKANRAIAFTRLMPAQPVTKGACATYSTERRPRRVERRNSRGGKEFKKNSRCVAPQLTGLGISTTRRIAKLATIGSGLEESQAIRAGPTLFKECRGGQPVVPSALKS